MEPKRPLSRVTPFRSVKAQYYSFSKLKQTLGQHFCSSDIGWGFGQPDPVKGVPAHHRGTANSTKQLCDSIA